MVSIKDKLLKNSTIKITSMIGESKIFKDIVTYPTEVPMLNVALSGKLDGGMSPGILQIAGPSKHFKSLFSLLIIKAYMDKEKDGIVLFYDNEFGATIKYFKTMNIDMDRVVHTPITDVEELKFDIMKQIYNIELGDKVFIFIDSIGNIASKKEIEDALKQNSAADMTRAKQLKSLFRMITPHLIIKRIPLIAVNHTYKEQALYPKDIVSGGTGSYYSSDDIWIVGRQQEKDSAKELIGYNFIIKIEKSRTLKEGSKFPITVTWDAGVHKWSGLFDFALNEKIIAMVAPKKYALAGDEENVFDRKSVENDDLFWTKVLEEYPVQEIIERKYQL